jgi:hypothetical protein
VLRNAELLERLREFRNALPYLERELEGVRAEYERGRMILLAWPSRKCSARRRDGQPCGCWAIRGGTVCRVHGGAAPQVRRKARDRLEAIQVNRQILAQRPDLWECVRVGQP